MDSKVSSRCRLCMW